MFRHQSRWDDLQLLLLCAQGAELALELGGLASQGGHRLRQGLRLGMGGLGMDSVQRVQNGDMETFRDFNDCWTSRPK